jgi:hypothetical protein
MANLDRMLLKGKLPASVLQISDDNGTTTAVPTPVTYAVSVSITTNIIHIYTTTTAAATTITTATTSG